MSPLRTNAPSKFRDVRVYSCCRHLTPIGGQKSAQSRCHACMHRQQTSPSHCLSSCPDRRRGCECTAHISASFAKSDCILLLGWVSKLIVAAAAVSQTATMLETMRTPATLQRCQTTVSLVIMTSEDYQARYNSTAHVQAQTNQIQQAQLAWSAICNHYNPNLLVVNACTQECRSSHSGAFSMQPTAASLHACSTCVTRLQSALQCGA